MEQTKTIQISESKFSIVAQLPLSLSQVEWRKQSLPCHPFSCLTLFFGMLSDNLLQRERRTHIPRLQLTACDAAIQRRSGSDRGAACGYDRGQPCNLCI